ncbi:MAG: CHAT domain-containing protein [Candidatus Omnitrophota bacterium]|nr:CHAT domain-containing protein [Candidatus Omnitrophota bacterium]
MQPAEYRYTQWGRFDDLNRHMTSKVKNVETAKTQDLMFLCYGAVKIKDYAKAFTCADAMETNILEGDRTVWGGFDMGPVPQLVRAEAYTDFGDYERAALEAQKAYEIVTETKGYIQFKIFALSQLALARALNGDHAGALKSVGELERMKLYYPNNVNKTDKFNGLSRAYMALGEYDKAFKAAKMGRDTGFKVLTDVVTGNVLLGESLFAFVDLPRHFIETKALYEIGKTAEAKAGYERLLAHPGTASNGDIYWMILLDRGRIAEDEGDEDDAAGYYEKAASVIEQQRSTINTEASKIGYVGSKQAVYHRMIALLYRQARYAAAFEYAERSKSRALVDLLASRKGFATKRGDEKEIQAILERLDQFERRGKIQHTDDKTTGSTRSGDGEAFREQLHKQDPELASLVTVTTAAAEEIQTLLAPDEALLEYYVDDDSLYAFVLTRQGVTGRVLDGSNLRADVQEFRRALEDTGSDRYRTLAADLYDRLIRPVEEHLEAGKLILVPHGVLHYIPFHALKSGDSYLLDRYELRYLPSATVMRYLPEARSKEGRVLAVGNPTFDGRREPLRHAEAEARAVSEAFADSTLLIGQQATESVFKKIGGEYGRIHMATHGFFEPARPLVSGLLLARGESDDGLLTVGELYELRLNADLVTLSACETGLSVVGNGDDLVGLTRGFLYAGSSSIVSSLWSVDDEATSFFMKEFYANLARGNKADAIRRAQVATRAKHEHPFYWAAFQLTGRS